MNFIGHRPTLQIVRFLPFLCASRGSHKSFTKRWHLPASRLYVNNYPLHGAAPHNLNLGSLLPDVRTAPSAVPLFDHLTHSSDRRPTLHTMISDINDAPAPAKAPCNCGCKGDKSKLVEANMPSSPEFNKRVDEGVRALLERARHVRINGRPRYLFLQNGRLIGVASRRLK